MWILEPEGNEKPQYGIRISALDIAYDRLRERYRSVCAALLVSGCINAVFIVLYLVHLWRTR